MSGGAAQQHCDGGKAYSRADFQNAAGPRRRKHEQQIIQRFFVRHGYPARQSVRPQRFQAFVDMQFYERSRVFHFFLRFYTSKMTGTINGDCLVFLKI